MPAAKYFILLSNEGDFLHRLSDDMWKATFYFNDATIFDSESEANEYLFDLSIRSIWPQARVEIIFYLK